MSKICPNCGTQLPDDSMFCTNCGKPYSAPQTQIRTCSACGALLRDDSQFCERCGAPVFAGFLRTNNQPTMQNQSFSQGQPAANKKKIAAVCGAAAAIIIAVIGVKIYKDKNSVTHEDIIDDIPYVTETSVIDKTDTGKSTDNEVIINRTQTEASAAASGISIIYETESEIFSKDEETIIADETTSPEAVTSVSTSPEKTSAEFDKNGTGRPDISDFEWYNDLDEIPDGAEIIIDPEQFSGRWKAMNIYIDNDGTDLGIKELLNVDIMAGEGAATVVYDWYKIRFNGEDWTDESEMDDITFYPSVSSGSLYGGSDYGILSIDVFWEYQGAQYALGTLTLPDGSTAFLEMTRP